MGIEGWPLACPSERGRKHFPAAPSAVLQPGPLRRPPRYDQCVWTGFMRAGLKTHFLLYVLLCCGLRSTGMDAQELRCDAAVRPLAGSPFSYQNRGNRCEGLYVADVGSRSVDVISFTFGRVTYDVRSKLPLRVSVSSKAPTVNVRAVAIPPKTYYRMDTLLRPGVTLVWPTTDVLLPENLTDNRIGIFGWTGTEDAKTFVPVRVVMAGSPAAAPGPVPTLLSIQPSFDAEAIKWRWAPAQGPGCMAFGKWQDAITQPVTANFPVRINLRPVLEKFSCVEVVARSRDSLDWATLRIHVEIPER